MRKAHFWTEQIGHELYLYCDGELIWKRWHNKRSVLFNRSWLPEWLDENG